MRLYHGVVGVVAKKLFALVDKVGFAMSVVLVVD